MLSRKFSHAYCQAYYGHCCPLFASADNGARELKSYKTVIASGTTTFSADQWHNLKLSFAGTSITACVDNTQVASTTNADYSAGLVGLGTGWNFAQFSNLNVSPVVGG